MKQQKTAPLILFISLVIVMLGFGIALPLLPFYVTHFNASGSALGLMISLYSFTQFLFAPVWGRASDKIGRKPVLLVGILGFALAFVLQGLAQNIFQLIAARVLGGMLSAAALPTSMAYIADITSTEDRSKGVGLMGAAMGLGMVLGPSLGGFLTKIQLPLPDGLTRLLQVTTDASTGAMVNLSIPFFASAILALLAALFIIIMLPESFPPEKRLLARQEQKASTDLIKSLWSGLQGPLGFLFIMAFLLAFALANVEAVLSLYGAKRFSMGPMDIGLLMGGIGVLSVVQQGLLIGPLTRRFGEARIIQAGLLVGIVGFIGLALSPWKWLMVISALIFNAGNVLLQPSVTALISKRAVSGQGEAMGINNSFQSLGRAIGPLWAGFAFDIFWTLAFWSGALIQVIALLYSNRMLGNELKAFQLKAEKE